MENFCFVVMPFGGQFNDIYRQIYVPAIRKVGLEPLRADDIYDNQPIIQDIKQSIQNATVVLAEVTGRNPNVNYELGMAHALGKEVIIVTANKDDVPSDYRHLRYLPYNPSGIKWDEALFNELIKTLDTVLGRLRAEKRQQRLEALKRASENMLLPEIESRENYYEDLEGLVIGRAKRLGYEYINDSHTPSHALLRYGGSHVMLDSREGPVTEWEAAAACLLTEKVFRLAGKLPDGHLLRMRSVFYDLYATHAFWVDYIYDIGKLPIYTANEILQELEDEFDGEIFTGNLRYIEENFDHDHFNADSDQYYHSSSDLAEKNNAVCVRDGSYVADIIRVASSKNGKHFFYMLDGLLPLPELGVPAYTSGESHWLADWNKDAPRFKAGETIKFRIIKVRELRNWDHVSNARNIDFVV